MEFEKFVNPNGFSVLVHAPNLLFSSPDVGIVTLMDNSGTVLDYLKSVSSSEEKIFQVIPLVKLKSNLLNVSFSCLTDSEKRKVSFASILLRHFKKIVFYHFFDGLIYSEKEYFKRLFRNLISKQGIQLLLLEDDMNFVCETVKQFYLFKDKTHYKLVTDFYDDEIYQYVDMPYTVELVKYFESCGHSIDHEITFNETLKAIYRGVK